MISHSEKIRLGKKEAREVDTSLPLKARVLAEVKDYNSDYGIASVADVVTEINTRGKNLTFQGELEHYAKKDTVKVQKVLNQLVEEGKVRRVKVPGAKVGYAISFRTNHRTHKPFPQYKRFPRRKFVPKAIMDYGPSDVA